MDGYRVWAEIDLDALAHNLHRIRSRVGARPAIWLVVKADAYGHGAVAIAHLALKNGVSGLGVGTSAEALELRRAGVRAPLLVLGTVLDEEAPACLQHGIQIALHTSDRTVKLQELAARMQLVAHVHLKVDTGMGRLGVLPARAMELLESIHAAPNLRLAGTMTHISSPLGALDPATGPSLEGFSTLLRQARDRDLPTGTVHVANSAGIFSGLRPLYDAVRPGISAYGVLPGSIDPTADLRPVMALRSQIVFLKDLAEGATVGYGGTWRANRPTRVATLPLGYADGLPWNASNRGEVLVRGRRAPIIGLVSMDYTTIDVTDIPGVVVGDRATLFGVDGNARLTLEEAASRAGTIPYELTCSVGKRVERVYLGNEADGPSEPPRVRPTRVPTTRGTSRPGGASGLL